MAEFRADSNPEVAYLLKGYPRLSEIFIASEIHRLERTGLGLRLFVIKPADEPPRHPVIGEIRARPEYLTPVSTVSQTPAYRWLADNLGPFLGPLARVLRRRPVGLARAGLAALGQAVRARQGRLGWPRKVYMKELLLAVDLADRLLEGPARSPSARALRARRDHRRLARLDDHGASVLVHRPRQGRLLGGAQPGGAAAAQARGGELCRHLHRGRARASAATCRRDPGPSHLSRPQLRLRAAPRCIPASARARTARCACSGSAGWSRRRGST